jgi:hypothetical protein
VSPPELKTWQDVQDVGAGVGSVGALGALMVGLSEVFRSSLRRRPGRFGEATAYGAILAGSGALVVELTIRI